MSSLAGRVLPRAADVLDAIDFTPTAIRHDLDGPMRTPRLLHSAVELIDHAADLLSDSAGFVHDNERRWRAFHQRVIDESSFPPCCVPTCSLGCAPFLDEA